MIVDPAPNLGSRFDDLSFSTRVRRHEWFREARLGMFLHYGLYSLPGKGEWHMDFARIPAAEYNQLAAGFRAERFDADEQASLARRAGAGYVVTGARHHEGFCLFDSRTTNFTSVHSPCGRDLIAESVEAFRRANLRVGIYYSIMSWQWPAIHTGPLRDPEGWEAMVTETHSQVRELMTNYGRIDVLWYDGCVVPGVSDPQTIARHWRSRELNAMVRQLQPDILINDRSCLPEDYSTPEQHLTLPPRDRLWEMCLTINDHWGWFPEDGNHKSASELARNLVQCARYGGNLLLNIGPKPDGSLPAEQAERLEAVGRWMAINGEAVRNTCRTAYTEAEHLLGIATSRGKRLYFHVSEWPGAEARIAGLNSRILSARLLSSDQPIAFDQFADGTATLRGLPGQVADAMPSVVELRLEHSAPSQNPPELLIEKNTGLFDPAEAEVHAVKDCPHQSRYDISFYVPATGRYRLELNVVGSRLLNVLASIDRQTLPGALPLHCIDYPQTVRPREVRLTKGRHTLHVMAEDGAPLGLLAWRLQPVWRQLRSDRWQTTGPFPSPYRVPGREEDVLAAMTTEYPPEAQFRPSGASGAIGNGRVFLWESHRESYPTIDFSRSFHGGEGVCFGQAMVFSLHARETRILLGCDWWANLYVNGRMVRSCRNPAAIEKDGSWFNGWKPLSADIRLEKGDNIFLVKCHQGRAGNWFSFYLHEDEASLDGKHPARNHAASDPAKIQKVSLP